MPLYRRSLTKRAKKPMIRRKLYSAVKSFGVKKFKKGFSRYKPRKQFRKRRSYF